MIDREIFVQLLMSVLNLSFVWKHSIVSERNSAYWHNILPILVIGTQIHETM